MIIQKSELGKIAWVLKARAKNDMRPVLTGLYIESADDKVRFTCADGYRIHSAEIQASLTAESPLLIDPTLLDHIWDKKTLSSLKLVSIENQAVVWEYTMRHKRTQVATPRIVGKFPAWQTIVPSDPAGSVNLPKSLVESVAEFNPAATEFDVNKDNVKVTIWKKVPFKLQTNVKLENPTVTKIRFVCDVDYLNDLMITDETLLFTSPVAPIMIKRDSLIGIIMPMSSRDK